MKSVLDDYESVSRIDAKDMLGAVENLPEFMLGQLEDGSSSMIRRRGRLPRSIVLMGMGGSASAADVTLGWLGPKIHIPSMVHRYQTLPRFVDSDTLFVALSYSGDTRETLLAFREARKRGAYLVGIGTGGKLRGMVEDADSPFLRIREAPAPRAALGQMVVACTQALYRCAVIQNPSTEIGLVIQELRRLNSRIKGTVRFSENPAKRLASTLKGRVPVVVALQRMSAVAQRFKNQLAENSKVVSKYSLLPEAAHNEIEGWHNQGPTLVPVFVRDSSESDLEETMVRSFRDIITKASGISPEEVKLGSRTPLGSILSPILYLDYVSVYLAILRGLDPADTPWIRRYKARL